MLGDNHVVVILDGLFKCLRINFVVNVYVRESVVPIMEG
jgi:hypothetical protein